MWKTAFKKLEGIWSASADHIPSKFLKAVFHKFCILLGPFLNVNVNMLYIPNINRLYIPKCEGAKGLISIQDCVNDKNESLALHIGTSNDDDHDDDDDELFLLYG